MKKRFGRRHQGRKLAAALGLLGFAGLVLFLRWRAGPAVLELVALNADGKFETDVAIPASWADSVAVSPGAIARVPLVLAVRNAGGQTAQPSRVQLNLPVRYRLTWSDGTPLPGRATPGNPLVRYEISAAFPPLEPGQGPVAIPALDTLWLEPVVSTYHCVALSDSVPDFVPAPNPGAESLRRLQIFYSFLGEGLSTRQAGLLTVELDPALLEYEPPEPPPVFPAQVRRPSVPMPPLSGLTYLGYRQTFCGPPEEPLELFITTWTTLEGGYMYVVDYGGTPRKYLFDLSGDGVIELEMWDGDGDGRFEARRAARLQTPAFLLPPEPPAPSFDPARLAELSDDEVARLNRFGMTPPGRYSPRFDPGDDEPRKGRLAPRSRIEPDRLPTDEPREHVTQWGPAHPLAGIAPAPAAKPSAPRRAPRPTDAAPSRTQRATPAQPTEPRVLGEQGAPVPRRRETPEPPARPEPPAQRAPEPAAPAPSREPLGQPAQPATPTPPPPAERPDPEPPEPRQPPREIELLGVPVDSL